MKKIILACLCLALGALGYHFLHKPEKKPRAEYSPKTWSTFSEYSRLEMLLKGFAIQSMIDVPSADVEDLKTHQLPLQTYIGACKDKENALALQARFGSEKRSFHMIDPTMDLLPKADLIFAWDLLTTLKRSEVHSTLLHFKKSGARFLLMAHDPTVTKNHKNKTGLPQAINWKIDPYNFPDPLITFDHYALWSLETL